MPLAINLHNITNNRTRSNNSSIRSMNNNNKSHNNNISINLPKIWIEFGGTVEGFVAGLRSVSIFWAIVLKS